MCRSLHGKALNNSFPEKSKQLHDDLADSHSSPQGFVLHPLRQLFLSLSCGHCINNSGPNVKKSTTNFSGRDRTAPDIVIVSRAANEL
jgi:hypothetical protein